MKKEFNLLDENWVRVLLANYTTKEVSLKEVLTNAEKYNCLAGDNDVQDVSVFRLILAASHAIFYKFDIDGSEKPIASAADAIDRWKAYREQGHFPNGSVETYLNQYKERFWLFHPDCPFYQSNVAKKGTHFTVAKLNGEVSESGNKPRLFSPRAGEAKYRLTYAEAARWLLYIIGYDDVAVKPSTRGLPSIGIGWVGGLTTVRITGHNLFESLMLNLVPLQGNGKLWSKPLPIWECEPRSEERVKVEQPSNPTEMLTFQSRRIWLEENDGIVTGFRNLGGEYFKKENAFAETMTIWNAPEEGNSRPYHLFEDTPSWKLLDKILGEDTAPKSIKWLRVIEEDQVILKISTLFYTSKASSIRDQYSNTIAANVSPEFSNIIVSEVTHCKEVEDAVKTLEYDIQSSAGKANPDGTSAAKEFSENIELDWQNFAADLKISSIQGKQNEAVENFENSIKNAALRFADELISRAPLAALAGRAVVKNGEKKYYSSAKALNWFEYRLKKIYSKVESSI